MTNLPQREVGDITLTKTDKGDIVKTESVIITCPICSEDCTVEVKCYVSTNPDTHQDPSLRKEGTITDGCVHQNDAIALTEILRLSFQQVVVAR